MFEGLFAPVSMSLPFGTLEIVYPWVLLLVPLPLLLTWRLAPYRTHVAAVHMPFFGAITRHTGVTVGDGSLIVQRRRGARLLGVVIWLLLLGALSNPHRVDPPLEKIIPARDLLLAVDISQSMETKDFSDERGQRISRLAAAKQVLDGFVLRRTGDRLGLLVFADNAHLQAPFTLDHPVLQELLLTTEAGMAGPRTMIGDAIGLGIRVFEASTAPQKVMILLTDGADTGSRIPPETAARIAAQHGITIHTVALGDPRANGGDKLDVAALKAIAQLTGGRFAMGSNLVQLDNIYRRLDALETRNFSVQTHRQRHPLYFWPLGTALLIVLLANLTSACLASWRERQFNAAVPSPNA
jgi:Ca-activated chloride channel family protein